MNAFYLNGIGALGPGFANWPALAALLGQQADWELTPAAIPSPQILPPAERRRVGPAIKLALAIGCEAAQQAERNIAELPTVFSSSGGDGDNCHLLCEALAQSERFISPTRFHNSVHNAPSGYWSIASGCMASSTSLCAHDASFGAGLIESAAQLASGTGEVLLITHDSPYPQPILAARPMGDHFGCAMLLSASPSAHSIARLELKLGEGAHACLQGARETLRRATPAARALPLLAAIAQGQAGTLSLEYLPQLSLNITLSPLPACPA